MTSLSALLCASLAHQQVQPSQRDSALIPAGHVSFQCVSDMQGLQLQPPPPPAYLHPDIRHKSVAECHGPMDIHPLPAPEVCGDDLHVQSGRE